MRTVEIAGQETRRVVYGTNWGKGRATDRFTDTSSVWSAGFDRKAPSTR
jgi:hypothetical protein